MAALLIAVAGAFASWIDGQGSGKPQLRRAGWGPPRPVYWCKRPFSCDGADHVAFNSYANAPNYGEEMAFVDAKPNRDTASGGFHDVLDVVPGEILLVRLYVNNTAWAARIGPKTGLAKGTTARVAIPLTAGTQHDIFGFISARNASPRVVWDGVTLRSDKKTIVRFQYNSARWWTSHFPGTVKLSDALVEEGTSIGSWALNGLFGDSFADSGLLTFRIKVRTA